MPLATVSQKHAKYFITRYSSNTNKVGGLMRTTANFNLPLSDNSERILKIVRHLAKLLVTVQRHVFDSEWPMAHFCTAHVLHIAKIMLQI